MWVSGLSAHGVYRGALRPRGTCTNQRPESRFIETCHSLTIISLGVSEIKSSELLVLFGTHLTPENRKVCNNTTLDSSSQRPGKCIRIWRGVRHNKVFHLDIDSKSEMVFELSRPREGSYIGIKGNHFIGGRRIVLWIVPLPKPDHTSTQVA